MRENVVKEGYLLTLTGKIISESFDEVPDGEQWFIGTDVIFVVSNAPGAKK